MIVCSCEGISEAEVRASVRYGAQCLKDLTRLCGAGAGCSSCHYTLKGLIKDEVKQQRSDYASVVMLAPATS